jgi:predicted amidohydrolase
MRIATIQYRPAFKDVDGNLLKLKSLIEQAASNGAEICCCPELATSGYSFMSYHDAEPFSEVLVGMGGFSKTMRFMHGLANNLDVKIVWGMMERDAGTRDLYNSQVMMWPNERFITMRKLNRWGNDFLWAKEGTASPPIVTITDRKGQAKKVGLLICRDVIDEKKEDKISDFYEPGDADIVCLSANWGKGGFPSVSWMDFVRENKCALGIANRYGTETNNDFGQGGICIVQANGQVITEGLVWGQDCIVYGEV